MGFCPRIIFLFISVWLLWYRYHNIRILYVTHILYRASVNPWKKANKKTNFNSIPAGRKVAIGNREKWIVCAQLIQEIGSDWEIEARKKSKNKIKACDFRSVFSSLFLWLYCGVCFCSNRMPIRLTYSHLSVKRIAVPYLPCSSLSCLVQDFYVPKRSIRFYFSNVSRVESCRTKMSGEKNETLKHALLKFLWCFYGRRYRIKRFGHAICGIVKRQRENRK